MAGRTYGMFPEYWWRTKIMVRYWCLKYPWRTSGWYATSKWTNLSIFWWEISVAYQMDVTPPVFHIPVAYQEFRTPPIFSPEFWYWEKLTRGVPCLWYATGIVLTRGVPTFWYATSIFRQILVAYRFLGPPRMMFYL